MGIWGTAFNTRTLFRWDVFGVLVPSVFLAAGFGMIGVEWFPHNLLISQVCFSVAALLVIIKAILLAFETESSKGQKVLFLCLVSTLTIGLLWFSLANIEKHKTHPESLVFILLYLKVPWIHNAYWMCVGVTTFLLIQRIAAAVAKAGTNTIPSSKQRGFLDWKLQAENAMADLGPALTPIISLTERVGTTTDQLTLETRKALHYPTKKQLEVTRRGAMRLDALTLRMEKCCNRLENIGSELQEGLIGWYGWIKQNDPSLGAFGESNPSLFQLCRTMLGASQTTESFIETLENTKGISHDMNESLDRHIAVNRRILSALSNINDACLGALLISQPDAADIIARKNSAESERQ